MAALSEGALNDARGKPGVIVSQILRGIAGVTVSATAESGSELPDVGVALLGARLQRDVELTIISRGDEKIPETIVSVLLATAVVVEQCVNGREGLVPVVITRR
nr:hypothetical protein [Mycobacterium uberis]